MLDPGGLSLDFGSQTKLPRWEWTGKTDGGEGGLDWQRMTLDFCVCVVFVDVQGVLAVYERVLEWFHQVP